MKSKIGMNKKEDYEIPSKARLVNPWFYQTRLCYNHKDQSCRTIHLTLTKCDLKCILSFKVKSRNLRYHQNSTNNSTILCNYERRNRVNQGSYYLRIVCDPQEESARRDFDQRIVSLSWCRE